MPFLAQWFVKCMSLSLGNWKRLRRKGSKKTWRQDEKKEEATSKARGAQICPHAREFAKILLLLQSVHVINHQLSRWGDQIDSLCLWPFCTIKETKMVKFAEKTGSENPLGRVTLKEINTPERGPDISADNCDGLFVRGKWIVRDVPPK